MLKGKRERERVTKVSAGVQKKNHVKSQKEDDESLNNKKAKECSIYARTQMKLEGNRRRTAGERTAHRRVG